MFVRRAAQVCAESDLRPPASYAEAVARTQLLVSVRVTLGRLAPGVFAADPARLATAVGDGTGLSFLERRALRKQARALPSPVTRSRRPSSPARLAAAAAQLEQWRELSGGAGEPGTPADWTS